MLNTASIGSISSGTLRTEDLLDAFAFELEALVQNNADTWCSDAGRAERDRLMALIGEAREVNPDEDPDTAEELVQELSDELQEFAPAGCYFGAHEGDGADFGFWPGEDYVPEGWQRFEYTIGSQFASALINADASGLSDEEHAQFNEWEARETREFAGRNFHWAVADDSDEEFAECEVTGMRGQCCTAQLMVQD